MEVKLPSLGENMSQGDIVGIRVKVGEQVKKDQTLIEVETGKAIVEIPAPAGGTIKTISVQTGEKISVGQTLVILEDGLSEQPSSLSATDQNKPVPAKPNTFSPSPRPLSPAERKFFYEHGFDPTQVAAHHTPIPNPLPDFAKWGEIDRKPMSSLRQKAVEHLRVSAQIPQVTHFDSADITELEAVRKHWAEKFAGSGVKLTLTVVILKIAAEVLKKFSEVNASFDPTTNEIIYKSYFHLGLAVDTENGLLVPVIHHVDQKNLIELAREVQELSEAARRRKIKPEQMQGSTFTLSNLGKFGGSHFTPILHAPDAAILGIGQAEMQAVWQENAFVPRLMLPLSLTYDHRLIDGAVAARFTRALALGLTQPEGLGAQEGLG